MQQRVGSSVGYLGEHLGDVPALVIPCLRATHLGDGSQAGLWGSLLPTAYDTAKTFKPAPRQPVDEVLHVDGW